jgi:predicted SnoaL-like aldol condensation-catalyzing enzyme
MAALVLTSFAASAGEQTDNTSLVASALDALINRRDSDAADRYVAENYIEHNPRLAGTRTGVKGFVKALAAGFSDYRGTIEHSVASGDLVVVFMRWTGTQDGPFGGKPPTGAKVDFRTADLYRIADGKIAEHWDVVDSLTRAIQLGLVPAPK